MEAIDTPPRKAPTSLLNSTASARAARPTAQATANSTSNSWFWASRPSSGGITQRIVAAVPSTKALPTSSSRRAWPVMLPPPWRLNELSRIMARITAMSCTTRKPTAMRPCRESISRLSESSFTMMIVLEKVRHTAM